MRRFYTAYLMVATVLCVVALYSVLHITKKAETKLAAIRAETNIAEQSVTRPESLIKSRESTKKVVNTNLEATTQAERIKAAMDAEAAQINREIAMRPVPAPVIGWAPSGHITGRVFTNDDLLPAFAVPGRKPESEERHVVVDFKPFDSGGLAWRDAIKSGRCAAFSFRDAAGVVVNRLYCDPVVAR